MGDLSVTGSATKPATSRGTLGMTLSANEY